MIKLKKMESSEWAGNGFGTNAATWQVVGSDHIHVSKFSGRWNAVNTHRNVLICTGMTKRDCLEVLETKIVR